MCNTCNSATVKKEFYLNEASYRSGSCGCCKTIGCSAFLKFDDSDFVLEQESCGTSACSNKEATYIVKLTQNQEPEVVITSTEITDAISAGKRTLLVDASNGNLTVFLPTASSVTGQTFRIKKNDATANTVTVDGYGTEEIEGSQTITLSSQYQFVVVQSDGIGWVIWAN